MKRAALFALILAGCATAPPAPPAYERCRTPMPLELRLKRMEARIAEAFRHAPPLSAAEHAEMNRLADCFGGAVLGVGAGCAAEREAARANGLQARNALRGGEYAIPKLVRRALAAPLGGPRTSDLLVAMLVAEEAYDALERHTEGKPEQRRDPLAMMLVSADIQQAIICDAEDQARGRTHGLPFDAAAPVPPGP